MRKFEIVESDFWGYFPTQTEYTLRDDVLLEMKRIVYDAVFLHGNSSYRQRRKVCGVEVAYCLEASLRFHTAQFTFATMSREKGNAGQFVAYCMCAVLDQFGYKSTCTVEERQGLVEVVVAVPLVVAEMILSHLSAMAGETYVPLKVSTVVYSS